MENPHEAEQAVLLERIIKNVVSYLIHATGLADQQDKCNEAVHEMNLCIRVRCTLDSCCRTD